MSLKKEVRAQIDSGSHEKLAIMAEQAQIGPGEFAARILEKAIEYEWYEASIAIRRAERLGRRRRALDSDGGD